jgi:hypothetical protein
MEWAGMLAYAVAHVLGHETVEPGDRLGDAFVTGADYRAQILRVELGRKRSRADEVGEHHSQVATLGVVLRNWLGLRGRGCPYGNWGIAEIADRTQHLAPMTERDAEVLQILGRSTRAERWYQCRSRQISPRTRTCRAFRASLQFVAWRSPRSPRGLTDFSTTGTREFTPINPQYHAAPYRAGSVPTASRRSNVKGHPVKLVYYDDQSNSATVPARTKSCSTSTRSTSSSAGMHQPAGAGDARGDSEEENVARPVRNDRVQLSESPEFNTKSKSAFRYLPSLLGFRASCGLCPAHGSPGRWGSSLK